jgi:hypothetical protein
MSSQYVSIHSIIAGIQFSSHKPEKWKLLFALGIKLSVSQSLMLSTDSSSCKY